MKTQREQFEIFFKAEYWSIYGIDTEDSDLLDYESNEYINSNTQYMWEGWQASAAIERERIAKMFEEAGWSVQARLIRESV